MRWKQQGVPIHGYSVHMHTNIYRPQADIDQALQLAAKTGLQIAISEMDISINWADYDIPGQKGGVQGLTGPRQRSLVVKPTAIATLLEPTAN